MCWIGRRRPPHSPVQSSVKYRIAATFIFCSIPPLLALELADRAVVRFMAGFRWLGFQRTLARVMAAWVLYVAARADCYVAAHADCRRLCAAADPRGA